MIGFSCEKVNAISLEGNFTPCSSNQLRCYPNPFNPSTDIVFSVQRASNVSVTVYNILGQKVRTVVDRFLEPGEYRNRFDGTSLSTGIYFCALRNDMNSSTIKLLLVK